ncbi:MAG: flagellar hook-associated protein FlgL [Verrucomicrobiota bacterium]|jgi:flagellar hook-associated protein 3 FlgL
MRISNALFANDFLAQSNQLQSQQVQLQNEVSTGLKVTLPQDDPATMDQVLNLQTQAEAGAQYQSNITQLQATATTAASAMNSLQTITEQAGAIATEANGVNSPTQMANYATQVADLIQEALQAANTTDAQGNYIFGGTINNQPPFAATTDANGNVTAVTYQGNTALSQSQIGAGQTISAEVPGANTTGTGPTGLLADSRSGTDLFRDLISLQQDLTAGNTTAIASTDSPNLTKDENNIVSGIAQNGVMQSALESASTAATQMGTNITTQTSNLTSADLATTLTKLDQTQTAYQAALQSSQMIMGLSILDYINTTPP